MELHRTGPLKGERQTREQCPRVLSDSCSDRVKQGSSSAAWMVGRLEGGFPSGKVQRGYSQSEAPGRDRALRQVMLQAFHFNYVSVVNHRAVWSYQNLTLFFVPEALVYVDALGNNRSRSRPARLVSIEVFVQ